MLKELEKFKALMDKEEALREEKKKLLSRIIFTNTITLKKIPKSEKVLVEMIKNALTLNKQKCLWIDLSIYDSFLDSVYIFGREKDILKDIERIVRMIILRQKSMIGYTSINLTPYGRSLKSFIKFSNK